MLGFEKLDTEAAWQFQYSGRTPPQVVWSSALKNKNSSAWSTRSTIEPKKGGKTNTWNQRKAERAADTLTPHIIGPQSVQVSSPLLRTSCRSDNRTLRFCHEIDSSVNRWQK